MTKPGHYSRGRPPATVIGHTVDIDGTRWAGRERRPTRHGFAIELGWPEDRVPGPGRKGMGAPKAILTEPLADYLHTTPRYLDVELPIGNNILSRFRHAVRMDHSTQRARWWATHLGELDAMDNATFAARFDLKAGTVMTKRRQLLGPSQIKRSANGGNSRISRMRCKP